MEIRPREVVSDTEQRLVWETRHRVSEGTDRRRDAGELTAPSLAANENCARGHTQVMAIGDGELWRSAQGGDAEAFGVLFERHAPFIHRYCFRRTGDWARAEDLTSITFLEAWRRRHIDLAPGKVLPWFVGIATNVLRNDRRALRRHAAALARVPDRGVERDFADDVRERVRCEEQTRALLTAIRSLPRREQEALALVFWEGLSHADAAFALGVPEQTVRSRLFRARRRLRKHAAGLDASSPLERTAE